MRKRVKIAAIITACLPVAFSMAASQGQLEFKGLPMGSSLEEFRAAMAAADYLNCADAEKTGTGYCYGTTGVTYAGQYVLTISADFLNGRLAQISMSTLGGSGDLIGQAITSKYGKYIKRIAVTQTLPNGIKYKMLATTWRLKDGSEILIQDHPQPHNMVYVALVSSEWTANLKKGRLLTEKNKKDI